MKMSLSAVAGIPNNYFRVGVVGYSPPTKFNVAQARRFLAHGYDLVEKTLKKMKSKKPICIVSGLTNVGVPALAYELAKANSFVTAGIACHKAVDYEMFPVDFKILHGQNWGDESSLFLANIDIIIRVGGGKQSHAEVAAFKQAGGPVIEFNLEAFPS